MMRVWRTGVVIQGQSLTREEILGGMMHRLGEKMRCLGGIRRRLGGIQRRLGARPCWHSQSNSAGKNRANISNKNIESKTRTRFSSLVRPMWADRQTDRHMI